MIRHRLEVGLCAALLILVACSSNNSTSKAAGGANSAGGQASGNGGSSARGGGQTTSGGSGSGGMTNTGQGGASLNTGGAPPLGGAGTSTNGGAASAGAAGTSSAGGGSAGGSAGAGTGGGTAQSGGSAGASTGGASSGGAAGAGAGGSSATWHAATATAITDSLLTSEYNAWKTKRTKMCSNGSWVVQRDDSSVVSEGIAYGMLLSANMADRTLFDGLYKYYSDHLDANGLMNWATGSCDAPGNNNANAATDADLDAAMALIQANARWSDAGYLAQAKTLTAKILQFEVDAATLCGGRTILRPGDKFGGCSDSANQKINPSYFAPGYYRVFAHYFTDQATTWNALLAGSYELYVAYQARMSGLVPDWSKYDGTDWYGSGYSWDACRTPWRVMVDYAWNGEPRAQTFMQGVRAWVTTNGLGSMPNNSAFTGAFALAAAYDKTLFDSAVTSWLGASGADDAPYFQGTLRVLYLLAAAGKFPSTL